MWVASFFFVGLEDAYQLLRGKLPAELAEHFYHSAFTLGTTLQVSEGQWPSTRKDFDRYWNEACQRVVIDDVVRSYLHDLIDLRIVLVQLRPVFGPLLRFLTLGFLATGVPRGPACQVVTPGQQRRFEYLFLLLAFANRFLPKFIQQGVSYLLLADVRI